MSEISNLEIYGTQAAANLVQAIYRYRAASHDLNTKTFADADAQLISATSLCSMDERARALALVGPYTMATLPNVDYALAESGA